jgi:hypothetical protein
VPGLAHAQYGCERFASTLAWAYWPNPANSMRAGSVRDESAALAPAAFRALMTIMVGAPTTTQPVSITAFAPKVGKHVGPAK